MILLHPNSLVQASLPKILGEVPEEHFVDLKEKLQTSSNALFEALSNVDGVRPVQSSAAMYMMVEIKIEFFKDIENDVDFCKKLLAEQNCFTFPSECFKSANFFRCIICTKPEIL
jgi:aspartate/methionine/tyrosine aminotransferase